MVLLYLPLIIIINKKRSASNYKEFILGKKETLLGNSGTGRRHRRVARVSHLQVIFITQTSLGHVPLFH